MNKFLLQFFLVSTLALPGWGQQGRPNILWIVSEDTSPFMGCYGNTYATTPFIDKFAKQSVLYDNAFSTAPACSPARSTLITGLNASSLGTENLRSAYPIPAFIKFFPKYLRDAGYYTTNNAKKDYNTVDQPDAWNESSDDATYKKRKPGQPFFSVFNLGSTHESRLHKDVKKFKHDPEKVPIPPYHPSTEEMKHDWTLFYDNMQKMDEQVGRLLAELEEAGLAENTIVFYYSDHGGVVPGSKRFMNERGLKVPLIIRFPKKLIAMAPGKAGSRTDQIVSFEDFAPTILNLAGVSIPGYMPGKPFLGEQRTKDKEYAFAFRGRMDESIELVRSIRNKRFRYVRNYMPQRIYGQHNEYLWQAKSIGSWEKNYKAGSLNAVQSVFWKEKPTEELYDAVADPHNIKNLAGSKDHKVVLEKMRKDLREIILKNKDAGFIPESMKVEISKQGTIHEFAASDKYPLERILETAEMATTRDPVYLKQLTTRLSDDNSIVRYWAATGCVILANKAQEAKAKLTTLLLDKEPAVRIAAAEALYKLGDKTIMVPAITSILNSDNLFARLEALTVLENVGKDAEPALPAITKMIEARQTKRLKAQLPWQWGHDVKVAARIVSALTPKNSETLN